MGEGGWVQQSMQQSIQQDPDAEAAFEERMARRARWEGRGSRCCCWAEPISEEVYVDTEFGLVAGASDRDRRAFAHAQARSKVRHEAEAAVSKQTKAKRERRWGCGATQPAGVAVTRQGLLCKSGSEHRLAMELEREVYGCGSFSLSGASNMLHC